MSAKNSLEFCLREFSLGLDPRAQSQPHWRVIMTYKFEIYLLIEKPLAQVFDAVYEPKHLTKYFTGKNASAPLKSKTTVMWEFSDFPGAFPVKVLKSEKNKRIVLEWEANEGGYDTRVEFRFEAVNPRTTEVALTESGWKKTKVGLKSSYGNCFGWTHMLCCLKAYLEHGINLREGSFKPKKAGPKRAKSKPAKHLKKAA